jgi:hypothetical protein
MKLADKLYCAKVSNHKFKQERIRMTDEQGNKWYRYDRPAYCYSCTEHTIVAIMTPHIEHLPGFEPVVEEVPTIYLDDNEEVIAYAVDNPESDWYGWFTEQVFAEQHLLNHRAKYGDVDEYE